MFHFFRLPSLSSPSQARVLTGRLYSDLVSAWKREVSIRSLRRVCVIGLVAIALWLGAALPAPIAQAAATPEAEAYENGPIRQTRNPISGENFQGGVDAAALEHKENPRQPDDEDKNLFESIKDRITGDDSNETTTDLKTQKNPTLERYPKSLD